MNALARASKQALQMGARSFASGAYPERKVAVLGAAGEGPRGRAGRATNAQLTPWRRRWGARGEGSARGGGAAASGPGNRLPAHHSLPRLAQAASASPCPCS